MKDTTAAVWPNVGGALMLEAEWPMVMQKEHLSSLTRITSCLVLNNIPTSAPHMSGITVKISPDTIPIDHRSKTSLVTVTHLLHNVTTNPSSWNLSKIFESVSMLSVSPH